MRRMRSSSSRSRAAAEADRQLTVIEVAEILGARPKTVCNYARRGELVGRRIGRRWIFTQAALAAVLEVMPEWLYECEPRGLNGDSWARGESGPEPASVETPAAMTSRVQDAAKKFFDQMRAKATKEPRDPLDQRAHKSEIQRRRDP